MRSRGAQRVTRGAHARGFSEPEGGEWMKHTMAYFNEKGRTEIQANPLLHARQGRGGVVAPVKRVYWWTSCDSSRPLTAAPHQGRRRIMPRSPPPAEIGPGWCLARRHRAGLSSAGRQGVGLGWPSSAGTRGLRRTSATVPSCARQPTGAAAAEVVEPWISSSSWLGRDSHGASGPFATDRLADDAAGQARGSAPSAAPRKWPRSRR